MAHNLLIRNPLSLWATASTILGTELVTLDTNLEQAINGVGGSAHAPVNQIGLDSLFVTGPTQICYGGRFTSTVTGGIFLQDDDFPEYGPTHVGRTRVRMTPMLEGCPLNDALAGVVYQQQTGTTTLGGQTVPVFQPRIQWPQMAVWYARMTDCGVQCIAPAIDFSDGLGFRAMQWRTYVRGYDQATLSQVTISFKVGFAHTDLPSKMPKARVVSIDQLGNVLPLSSKAVGADADGYVNVPTPVSASAWYANGAAQSLTIACDQNNTIDVSQFTYAVEVVEEQGLTGYPWQITVKQPVLVANTGGTHIVQLSGTRLIDGTTIGNFGERALLTAGIDTAGTYNVGLTFSAGDFFVDTAPGGGGVSFQFVCITPGVTAATAPTRTSQIGGTFVDGTVVWKNVGQYISSNPQLYTPANGIWVSGLNEWQRAPDLVNPSDFTQGMIVPIAIGGSMGGALLQVSSSITSWVPGLSTLSFVGRGPDDDETTAIAGTELFAHGTIWLMATATFTDIVDAHFE